MCTIFFIVSLLGLTQLIFGLAQQTKLSFSCDGRITGYYADVSTGCQVYHMCDGLGRQFSYTCPNATLFQQRMLICDHWYMVNCSRAEKDYGANKLIGQHKPFVEDQDYYRTPRPDLLSAPNNETEFNIIYRTGRNQDFTTKNIVGLATDERAPTDQPTYFPPSHWSTSFSPQMTTENPQRRNQPQNHIPGFQKFGFGESKTGQGNIISRTKSKAISFDSLNKNGNIFPPDNKSFNSALPQKPIVNFGSNFKATTPVYPPTVEDTTSSANDIGLLPPIPYVNANNIPQQNLPSTNNSPTQLQDTASVNTRQEQNNQGAYNDELNEQPLVVFESHFKATTPVYPLAVEPTSPDPDDAGLQAPQANIGNEDVSVNFQSNFKATTPVYPLSVEPTSPDPDDVGLLAPQETENEGNSSNFESNYKATTPVYPNTVEPTSPDPFVAGLVAPEGNQNQNPGIPINFKSNYKATTPVYPSSVDSTSPDPQEVGLVGPKDDRGFLEGNENIPINFESKFKATTPVYPTFVEPTSPDPQEVGILGPKDDRVIVEGNENIPINFESKFKATTPVYPTFVEPTSPDPQEVGILGPKDDRVVVEGNANIPINFESKFKATTPVYPTFVEPTSPDPQEVGIVGPKDDRDSIEGNSSIPINFESKFKATTPVYPLAVELTSPDPGEAGLLPPQENTFVVFASNFTATTPLYPLSVEPTSPDPDDAGLLAPNEDLQQDVKETPINFQSNFKATTPVYPTHVEERYSEPEDITEAPPQENSEIFEINLGFLPPEFDENYKADKDHNEDVPLPPPSKFYQAPKYDPDYTIEEIEGNETPGIKILNFMKSFNISQWQNLRKALNIPEYDFPLDDATRPSYDSVLDSFDAKVEKKR